MLSNSPQREIFKGYAIHAYSRKGPIERRREVILYNQRYLEFLTHFLRVVTKAAMNERPNYACCAGYLYKCE